MEIQDKTTQGVTAKYRAKTELGKDFASRLGLKDTTHVIKPPLWGTGGTPVSSVGLVDLITQMAELAVKVEQEEDYRRDDISCINS